MDLELDSDIPAWMDLVHLVVDGYPYLKEEEYLEHLKRYIHKKQALVIKDKAVIIGAMAFDNETGSIDFLGVHPQYRKQDIAKTFLRKIWGEYLKDTPVSITTFREGDKADPGYREVFKKLGFAEEKLLIEFGYPTQKLTLQKKDWEAGVLDFPNQLFVLRFQSVYLRSIADTSALFWCNRYMDCCSFGRTAYDVCIGCISCEEQWRVSLFIVMQ